MVNHYFPVGNWVVAGVVGELNHLFFGVGCWGILGRNSGTSKDEGDGCHAVVQSSTIM